MKTKSRAVCRPDGEPMLEDGGSVSTVPAVGLETPHPPSVDFGFVSCPRYGNPLHSCMDIDGSGTYSDDISQGVMNGVDVVVVSSHSRNSLSINEPDPNRRPLVNVPVSGKRKRKMDDVPLCVGEASCTMPASPFKGFMSNEDTQSVFTVPSCSVIEQTPTTAVALSDIKPSDIGKAIHVKVYRKWTIAPIIGSRRSTLCLILLDHQGGAIQANVENPNRIRFDNILQKNGTYTITGFGLMETKKWMQTLPNRLTLILGSLTDAQPFSGTSFPAHHFNFAVYNELATRADNDDVILTDYIGCVMDVGDVCDVGNATREKTAWRDIMLRDLEGNTVTFTLWNEKARTFNTDTYEDAAKPTIMAVSSCWVKTYGGFSGRLSDGITINEPELDRNFGQRGLAGMSVTGVPGGLSNGITVNEPDPDHPLATRCLRQVMVPADITGKGKKKMDEISDLPGSHAAEGCSSEVFTPQDQSAMFSCFSLIQPRTGAWSYCTC